MTLFKMCDWEHNGHDDSDWYAVVYDDEKDTLDRVCTGTTRAANALHIGPVMEKPTPEIIERAKKANLRQQLPLLMMKERDRVEKPFPFEPGSKVRLLADCRVMKKRVIPCDKCSGSGNWINPRNAADKRKCFACKGTGSHPGERVKVDGHQEWINLKEGMTGEVVDSAAWGTFYRNGYNKPNRYNTRVQLRMSTGEILWVAGGNLRLDCEMKTEEEIAQEWAPHADNFYGPWATSALSML
jgi:hypothetical protein